MDRIEFLVEEPSIAEVLKNLLPQILPPTWILGENYFIRPHNGKQDLKQSIPHKIRGFSQIKNQVTGFVIVQDQDSNDCCKLKNELIQLCQELPSDNIKFCVRIVCHELESWYIGDMNAIHAIFPRFNIAQHINKNKFRKPDMCVNPKLELRKILGDYPQIATAREIGKYMTIKDNTSSSFQHFVSGVKRFVQE